MNRYFRKSIKSLAVSGLGMLILVLGQTVVRADEVNFTGSAGGCFTGAPTSCTTAGQAQTNSYLGLHYHGSTFNVTTSNGFAAVGNFGNPGGNFNNFGSFTLDSIPSDYNREFTLRLIFSSPSGVDPSPGRYPQTIVLGFVSDMNAGGVRLLFGPTTRRFETHDGFLEVTLNPISITPGQGPVPLTGSLRASTRAVPEPATLILLGTGLAGIGVKIRKRKRSLEQ